MNKRISASHTRYSRFLDYGDAESYHGHLKDVRCDFNHKKEKKKKRK